MKECKKETAELAYFLDPSLSRKTDLGSDASCINESCLIETLNRNKLVLKFSQKLENDNALKERIFGKFPRVAAILQQMNRKIAIDSLEFSKIKGIFRDKIEFMLIKSDGSFPYESDNIDVLIKPERLKDVVELLRNAGYSELPRVREPHKFLFRQKYAYDVLPLHIHTRVEWEGTQFIDSDNLWRRSRVPNEDEGFLVPSPEDCILITVAHLFFENHEVKLYDLLKIYSKLRDFEVNWDYIIEHSRRQHWDDAFLLTMLQLDQICFNLYNRNLILQSTLSKLEKANYSYNKLIKKFFNFLSLEAPPIRIPYSVSGLFFLRRIFHDSSTSLVEKINHIEWVASEVVKLRVKGKD